MHAGLLTSLQCTLPMLICVTVHTLFLKNLIDTRKEYLQSISPKGMQKGTSQSILKQHGLVAIQKAVQPLMSPATLNTQLS